MLGFTPVSDCATLFLIVSKLKTSSPDWLCFAHGGNWWFVSLSVIWSCELLSLVFSSDLAKETEWKSSLVTTWETAKVSPLLQVLLKYMKFHLSIREVFHWEGQEQVVQRVCGASILGDIKNSAGHSPKQPADTALSRRIRLDDLQWSLPASTVEWFCELEVKISLHSQESC